MPAEELGSGGEEYDESDEGDFIVDDDGKPIQRSKKKSMYEDEGLAAAQDIFGCDFDYGEFEQYDDAAVDDEADDDEEDDEYEEDDDLDEEDQEAIAARKEARIKKKEKKKKAPRKTIQDVFEPFELARGYLTDRDSVIRQTDKPERFQLRQIPVTPTRQDPDDRSIDPLLTAEAKWIYQNAFLKPAISRQDTIEDLVDARRSSDDRYRHRHDRERELNSKREVITAKIYNALDLMRNHQLEVPFIAFYRKEEVQPELKIHHLWSIYHYDEKVSKLFHLNFD